MNSIPTLTSGERRLFEDQLKSSLDQTYQDFDSLMSPFFGIDSIPKIPLKLDRFSILEGSIYLSKYAREDERRPKKEDEITLNFEYFDRTLNCCDSCFQNYSKTRSFVLVHELGHLAHSIVNPKAYSLGISNKWEKGIDWYYGEMIAELSALTFFEKIGRLNKDLLDFTLACLSNTYEEDDKYGPVTVSAYNFFKDKEIYINDKIFSLARMNALESLCMIGDYRKRFEGFSLIYLEDYFKKCFKEQDIISLTRDSQLLLFETQLSLFKN